jgi:hypothetical protein
MLTLVQFFENLRESVILLGLLRGRVYGNFNLSLQMVTF